MNTEKKREPPVIPGNPEPATTGTEPGQRGLRQTASTDWRCRISAEAITAVVLSGCLLICHFSIFLQFFPNRYGGLGYDYAIFLPALVDGFFWFTVNGLWAVPWFTPSFSGGGLGYLHLERAFYTLPQFLGFVFEPLTVIQISFIAFAAVGYTGCYLLLRQAFHTGRPAALLGACLFLFNGFYAHRMIIGHFGVSPFMLLPFVALALLHPLPTGKSARRSRFAVDVIVAGLMFAYMVQTWFALLMVPAILAVVSVGMVHGLMFGRRSDFWRRLAGAGAAGLLFGASKLTATAYLMRSFDRSRYLLPGASGFLDALGLEVRSLFISPAFDPERMQVLTHVQWLLDRHEWEFSVTPVPLLILAIGVLGAVRHWKGTAWRINWAWRQWAQIAVIAAIVLMPAALNTYTPSWNLFLKRLPLIKSASTLIRWFFLPIPLVIVTSALVVDRMPVWRKYRKGVAMAAIAIVVLINAVTDRQFYQHQFYDPGPMTTAYRQVASGATTPQIRFIFAHRSSDGQIDIDRAAPNDMFVHGGSPMLSYDAVFGYRQEAFPRGNLHPGPVMDEHDGAFNLKNPACYVWSGANQCRPGDHFTADQRSAAVDFVNYRPFAFKMPIPQNIANNVNVLSLAVAVLWLAACAAGTGIRRCRSRRRRRCEPGDRHAS